MMVRTSKLTQDKPKATVLYPDDESGPVTVKVTPEGEAAEPYTKKLTFDGGDDQPPPDDGDGDDGGPGEIQATVTQDQQNPRKVTVEVTQAPDSGDSGNDSGEPSNGDPGNEGGTQGTGASSADRTSPRAGDDNGSGEGSGSSQPLSIEWGGKTKGEAPTEITVGEPVTVTYDASVKKATITIDDDDESTEPFTKGVKFSDPPEQGDIVVDAAQDETNPRKITLTVKKAPGQDDSGGDGSGSDSNGSSGGQQ